MRVWDCHCHARGHETGAGVLRQIETFFWGACEAFYGEQEP